MKIKALLYCTKQPHKLYATDKGYLIADCELGDYYKTKEKLNGKIVAECDYDVEEICSEKIDVGVGYEPLFYTETTDNILKQSCLTQYEIENYLGCKAGGEVVGYAIYIKNLHIFDEPRELREYYNNNSNHIEKAPQNMMYARQIVPFKKEFLVKGILQEVRGYKVNEYILISIQPQWMCLILNHIKDVEVRKVVLKEMLKND